MNRYLDIGQNSDGELIKLTVCGELDFSSGGPLRASLEQAHALAQEVRLDLSSVSVIDSAGINLLAEAAARAHAAGGSLSVAETMVPQVRGLLDLLPVERLLREA